MRNFEFETLAIHGGDMEDLAFSPGRMPVYESVAFQYADAEKFADVFQGRKFGYTYSRIANPTVLALEKKLVALESGQGAVAVSSGMAAIFTVLMSLTESGDAIIAHKSLFAGTYSLLTQVFRKYNVRVVFIDVNNRDELAANIDDSVKAVFVESIGNPRLDVPDIAQIATVTDAHAIPLIVDSTVTTPYLFQAKDHGVTLVVHSLTKYLTGNGSVIGGIIVDTGVFDWSKSRSLRIKELAKKTGQHAFLYYCRKEMLQNTGATLSAGNAVLHIAGIETLALRMDRHCENAHKLAEFLVLHPKVRSVNYPGLPDSPFHAIANKQFGNRFGGILTIRLNSKEECFRLVNGLKMVKQMANIGDVKTLIIHPASTIFGNFDNDEKQFLGAYDDMLRISTGIEHIRDIIADFDNALKEI